MADDRLRIFSDLHFRDPRGELHDLADFAPLLGDAGRVVFNGDSLDTQVPSMARHSGELLDFAARSGRCIDWLTGNHDPDFAENAELSLADGRIWITHGDVFFDAIAPWSHHAAELRRRIAENGSGLPVADLTRIETRLRLHRIVARALPEPPHLFEPGLANRAYRVAHALFPPRRLVSILHTWATTPRTVAALARAQRPQARVVLLGHTHYPGVWRVRGRRDEPTITVINTGSFTRPFGALLVEVRGEHLRVLRIHRTAEGFREGRTIAEFPLEKSGS
jgi:predicted phosphodiesterase